MGRLGALSALPTTQVRNHQIVNMCSMADTTKSVKVSQILFNLLFLFYN